MTPEQRHQRLTELLSSALDHPPQERAAFLHSACGENEPLRREVESLLASFEQASSFIETPAFADAENLMPQFLPADDDESLEGRRLGAYQLVREIGRGGMGAVYLAQRADEQFREKAALKIVKRGMDTKEVVRRFRHERQIMASLHHPNIAGLLDGGTTEDGLPYFVMEFIEGEPIDAYCHHHQLSVVERLKLFRTVCAAVHYAHQNLVIHRDIKPSNILVTADGTPKLLDFGIAKILNPEISQTLEKTATQTRLMTPEYASPEQVRGETVTTATDVYSLGVVLYELLTGHRPYRINSILPSDIERIICEQEPIRPSTAAQAAMNDEKSLESGTLKSDHPSSLFIAPSALRGDLDNIVLMALRKEPARRFASVEHLSEDIRRHLVGLPVTASQDTLGYRAGKFIRRHRAGVTAGVLVILSLIAGMIATIWQARRAQKAQARAERRFNDVRVLANAYLFEFHDAIANLPGSTAAREIVVRRAQEYLDSLAREAGDDLSLQQELAAAYLRVADVQGRPGFPNLGRKGEALENYRKALFIHESLLTGGVKSAEFRRNLATNYDRLGDTLRTTGDSTGALVHYQKSLALRENLPASGAVTPESRSDLASSYQRIGDLLALTGDLPQALAHQRKALPLFETVAAADPKNAKAQRDVFIGCIKLGDRLLGTGDRPGALEQYRQALPIARALAEAEPQNARAQREFAIGYDKVGNALAAMKRADEALVSYNEALKIRRRLAGSDEQNAEARRDLSISYDKLGGLLAASGKTDKAIEHYRQALAIDTALSLMDKGNAQIKLDRANSFEKIGEMLTQKNNLNAALDSYRQSLALREEVVAIDRINVDAVRDLASSCLRLGEISTRFAGQGKTAVSQSHWREAKQWYQRSLDLLLDLQKRGALSKDDADEPDRIRNELIKCELALKK
jgi:non-specific serine/threonine protein kinase/serine/threonine-protein kinase